MVAPESAVIGEVDGTAPEAGGAPVAYSWRGFLFYFLRLGTFGFGGPIALAGHMQRDLVDERRWISKQDYDEGLALSQLSPGPLAAQLAIYLGWVRGRALGASLVSAAFVGPSFVMVLALSALYLRYGGLPWIQGAFYGIGATVVAIIARSAFNLLRKTLQRDAVLWSIAVANAVLTAVTESEKIVAVLAGGLIVIVWREHRETPGPALLSAFPAWLVAGTHGPVGGAALGKVLAYFAMAGAFVFGSGLAIVPFLHGGVVADRGWLTERQFVDAVAVAMITPGPVVITVAFIGYLVAGPLGATLAAVGVFLPSYLVVLMAAPYYRKLAGKGRIKAFVAGVTAGAVGALAGAVVVLARKTIADVPTLIIATISLVLVLKVKRLPEPILILAAAVVGVAIGHRGAG